MAMIARAYVVRLAKQFWNIKRVEACELVQ